GLEHQLRGRIQQHAGEDDRERWEGHLKLEVFLVTASIMPSYYNFPLHRRGEIGQKVGVPPGETRRPARSPARGSALPYS
ncbi:hypothetical protein, partial [Variovorax guangxiensis]|uniref:hypothetical protein n=1 Tax=Variovorax guangxiensis TaxID=1775474 RepID=UPI00286AB4A7